jgi:hypothetical protein
VVHGTSEGEWDKGGKSQRFPRENSLFEMKSIAGKVLTSSRRHSVLGFRRSFGGILGISQEGQC